MARKRPGSFDNSIQMISSSDDGLRLDMPGVPVRRGKGRDVQVEDQDPDVLRKHMEESMKCFFKSHPEYAQRYLSFEDFMRNHAADLLNAASDGLRHGLIAFASTINSTDKFLTYMRDTDGWPDCSKLLYDYLAHNPILDELQKVFPSDENLIIVENAVQKAMASRLSPSTIPRCHIRGSLGALMTKLRTLSAANMSKVEGYHAREVYGAKPLADALWTTSDASDEESAQGLLEALGELNEKQLRICLGVPEERSTEPQAKKRKSDATS